MESSRSIVKKKNDMTKAIVFDMGGVLVDLDLEACKKEFRERLGYGNIEEILDPCHQKGAWGLLEEGSITDDEFREFILKDSKEGTAPEDVDAAMWKILKGIEPYKAELLKKLSERYEIHMLSNNNGICLPEAERMFERAGVPLDTTFGKLFMSFRMKALKPSEKIYREIISQLGLPAEQLLFIDDSRTNVEASIEAGMPAVHYEPGTDLSALLADVLQWPELASTGAGCVEGKC